MLRAFVALLPPQSFIALLEKALGELRSLVPPHAVRWPRVGNIHLTLCFIGNVPTRDVPALQAAISRAVKGLAPITLHLGQPGCFPNQRSPKVLWMGLNGDLGPLEILQQRVQHATAAWGKPESRGFHPHLTLGRVNSKDRTDLQEIGTAIRNLHLPTSGPWRAGELHLMRSELRPSGAVYASLGQFSLAS